MQKSPKDQTIDFIHLAARYLEATREHEATREALFRELPVLLPGARQAAQGMSQADLAENIQLHETAISKIENGRQIMSMPNLAKMVALFADLALDIPGPRAVSYDDKLLEAVYLFQSEYPDVEPVDGD